MSDHYFSDVSHSRAIRPDLTDRRGNVFPSQFIFFCLGADSGGKSQTRSYFWPLPPKLTPPPRILIIIIFYSFLHVLLSPNDGTTAGLFILISILNEGGDWAENRARACALNFTLIGYKCTKRYA